MTNQISKVKNISTQPWSKTSKQGIKCTIYTCTWGTCIKNVYNWFCIRTLVIIVNNETCEGQKHYLSMATFSNLICVIFQVLEHWPIKQKLTKMVLYFPGYANKYYYYPLNDQIDGNMVLSWDQCMYRTILSLWVTQSAILEPQFLC